MNIDEKYERLLGIFEEISKIPRNSGEEKDIAIFVCDFAEKLGLEYKMDSHYNVIVKRPADSSMVDKKRIIFQAHLDMVCEKNDYSDHDFNKDPIEIIKSENIYSAKGTTLGADDGIGVSLLLLLMESSDIKLPFTYFIFTTQEEVSMAGAMNIDLSDVDASYLINLDSEEENSVIVGCAGGLSLYFEKEDHLYDINDSVYELSIAGLKGGHSGVDIDKGRMNANYLAAYILSKFSSVHLISFEGGSRTNVIPNSASVIFSAKSLVEDEVNDIIKNLELSSDDRNLNIKFKKLDGSFLGLSELASKEVLSLLLDLKQGVISSSSIVETSGNVAVVDLKDGITKVSESLRSNISSQLTEISNANIEFAGKLGFVVKIGEEYPGWDCNPNSKLTDMYVSAYKNVHGEAPLITQIHAGLECGVLKEKLPNIDMISIGPDLKDVHTPEEKLYLDSCKKLVSTLIEFLAKID